MRFTKIAYTVSLLIFGLGLAVNGYSQSFLTNGLVAYYPFNGNANDASGMANNGTANGAVLAADRFGQVANAYAFNGAGAYVSAPNKSYLTFPNGGDFTISIWAAFNTLPAAWPDSSRAMVALDNGPGGPPKWIFMYGQLSIPGPVGYSSNYVHFGTTASSTSGYYLACTPYTPAVGVWHNYLITKAGTSYTLYVDGLATLGATNYLSDSSGLHVGVSGPSSIISGITAPLTIGWAEGPGSYHNGGLDDVRIYNRALSSNEVAQLYAIESTSPPPPCSPHKATATAQLDNGFVVGATITDPGCGYTNAPAVLIQGGGGSGATAIAVVSNGVVVRIIITDAGFGYTGVPSIAIGSPPFVPTVSIAVSKVKVTQYVVLGRNYVLEASTDLVTWTATGPQFTAQAETIVNEFDVDVTGRYFRIRQVP